MTGSRRRGEPGGANGADRIGFASLSLRQPPRGYRYSLDAVLLADFASSHCGPTVLDLGTGSGVVLLLLARMCPVLRAGVGVEIQRELWEYAQANIEDNGLSGRLSAVWGDFRRDVPGLSAGSCDLVVSNPPYRRIGAGRRNPDPQKDIARHEVSCTLPDLFGAAGRYLSRRGRFAMAGLPERLPEILSCSAAAGLAVETLRFVHPFPGRPSHLLLYAGSRRKRAGLTVLPPLFVYAEEGRYHPDVERIYGGLLNK